MTFPEVLSLVLILAVLATWKPVRMIILGITGFLLFGTLAAIGLFLCAIVAMAFYY